jgi:hypothetical protein
VLDENPLLRYNTAMMNEIFLSASAFNFRESVVECIEDGHCSMCDVEGIPDEYSEGGYWRDAISAKEYNISAMCQCCQDEFFEEED